MCTVPLCQAPGASLSLPSAVDTKWGGWPLWPHFQHIWKLSKVLSWRYIQLLGLWCFPPGKVQRSYCGCRYEERYVYILRFPHRDIGVGAWLIKTQRQVLGFNLKTKKAKQSVTGSDLNLSQKMVILPPGSLRMRLWLRALCSCFIIISSSGIKGMHHYCLVSMVN